MVFRGTRARLATLAEWFSDCWGGRYLHLPHLANVGHHSSLYISILRDSSGFQDEALSFLLFGTRIDHCGCLHVLLRPVHVLFRVRVRSDSHVFDDWHLRVQEDENLVCVPVVLLHPSWVFLHVDGDVANLLLIWNILLFLPEWLNILELERNDHLVMLLGSLCH